jgi:hypothetical protein
LYARFRLSLNGRVGFGIGLRGIKRSGFLTDFFFIYC